MDKNTAKELVKETFQNPFDKGRFYRLIKELLNHFEDSSFVYRGNTIPDAYDPYFQTLERIGKYQDPEGKKIDILIVKLKKETSLERARTTQRNFIAWYLNGSRGGVLKDAALVAFVPPDPEDWRFSLVKMEYKIDPQKGKIKEELTPARRYSFIVGKNESSHTAQSRLVPLLEREDEIFLKDIEEAFNVEKVTKEFFEKYREIFLNIKESLDEIVEKEQKVKAEFTSKNINPVDFAKKLLGQILFLYFLQKKGWFGVKRGEDWGGGSKHFLRELFEKRHGNYSNFFNDILEPLFYEALRIERPGDYYSRFDCRIPFLNGGLFDPINDYDWWNTDILLPNELFSNKLRTKEGDIGTGILDIFDRYNFTVKEDEPLEKEVAIDPELLGKAYEKFNAIRPDNYEEYKKALKSGKKGAENKFNKQYGVYYTPREIVHYMCQESLINYLATELEGKVSKEDIETLIKYGESVVEHDSRVIFTGRETERYYFKLPESIRKNAKIIDEKLSSIRVCDPAVGSGAFPVGMMSQIIRTRNALTPYLGEDKERSLYNFKRQAIQNCLYGVDIDPGAVEIAKLRLWLSLIVDEEDIKQIKPLPNLDYKIMQGDSLISEFMGIDLDKEDEAQKGQLNLQKDETNVLIQELKRKKDEYLNKANVREKQELKEEIEDLMIRIFETKLKKQKSDYFNQLKSIEEKYKALPNTKQREETIRKEKEKLYQTTGLDLEKFEQQLREFTSGNKVRPFFPWHLYFAEVFQEKGGFDVVIANPPYVDSETMARLMPKYREKITKLYFSTKGNWDLYIPFWELALSLLNNKGNSIFITPNKWLAINYGKNLRKLLGPYIYKFANCDKVKVFEAGNSPIIVFINKSLGNNEIQVDYFDSDYNINEKIIFKRDLLNIENWGFVLSRNLDLILKIMRSPKKISQDFYVENPFTVSEAYELEKILMDLKNDSDFDKSKHFKFVNTGTIEKYQFLWSLKQTTYLKKKYRFPIIKKSIFKNNFPKRYMQMNNQKIIISGIRHFECALDQDGDIIAGKSTIILKRKSEVDLRIIMAILNSKLISFYIKEVFNVLGIDGGINFTVQLVENLPIPDISDENQRKLKEIVDNILKLINDRNLYNNSYKKAKIIEYQKQIDQLVYKLYGLTPEEIKIVEESHE